MTTTAIEKVEAPVVEVPRALLRPIARPEQMIAVHREASELIRDALEDGRDYGTVPGAGPKKVLLKPGAERLCIAFGLSPRLEIIEKEIDHDRRVEWSSRNGSGVSRGLYRYVVRCVLSRDGVDVGSGIASCSTMETKFVRDPRSAENTAIKMASKRALVAAVLSTLALSDRFTQDVDDNVHGEAGEGDGPSEADLEARRRKMAEAKAAAAAKQAGPTLAQAVNDETKRRQEELRAGVSAQFDRLRTPEGERAEAVWRMLGGRKPSKLEDLEDVLAVLKDLPAPGGVAAKPLEPEVVEDEKKEGTE
jgi:hypothetical protein